MLQRLMLFTLLLVLAPLASARAADTPGQLVKVHSQLLLDTIDQRRAEFRQTPSALHDFLRVEMEQMFDRDYSARLVLARHGRQASPEEIRAFADALTNNLVNRYGSALLDIDTGVNVKIRAETPLREGRMMRVATEIDRRGGPPVPVDYLFHKVEDRWRVFDVIVEGVSYVQTYRNQFDELLRRESLASVTQKLATGSLSVAE
jgi:phospholipid transport system substrate-binding protein